MLNNEFHLVAECPAVGELRERLGITRFFNSSRLYGHTDQTAFRLFLGGYDERGALVEVTVFLARGMKLAELREAWLNTWSGK